MAENRAGAGEGPDAGVDGKPHDEGDPVQASNTADTDNGSGGGEDDSSTEKNGDDSHLHEDQKSRTMDT